VVGETADVMSDPSPLPDGTYFAFVVDADERPDGTIAKLSLTIVSGDHKGDVLDLAAEGLAGSFVDLVGMPATIVVAGGDPSVSIDD
jgi:hypothetical protein